VRRADDQPKPSRLVDTARRKQDVVGPERQFSVPGLTREVDADGDESLADAKAANGWIDDQQPQPPDIGRFPHQKHRAQALSVAFGHPAPLAGRVVVGQERAGDLRHQRLELFVEVLLGGVERAVALDRPADVAGLACAGRPGLHGVLFPSYSSVAYTEWG
jgi:hypothetical protein